MSRRAAIGLALALVLAGGLLLWWFSSGPQTAPPSQQPVPSLQDSVSIGWTDAHTAVIHAPKPPHALTALGYVHGMTRPWTLTVWRRTTLGTLSATFGTDLRPLDRHARRLGFGHHARRTYSRLSPPARRRLEAYVRGLNAALQSSRVRRRAPFVYLDLAPRRWQPWHALAVERLVAWIGTQLPPPDVPEFRRADRRLRHWLHLHGRSRSVAGAARSRSDTTRTALFTRHVLGATADPILQEVKVRRPHASPVVLATLPGTRLAPTGSTARRAWTALLGSPTQYNRVAVDTSRVRTRHERIGPAEGDEQLVTVRGYDGRLLLTPPSDSAWVLRWPGLRAQSNEALHISTALSGAPPDSLFSNNRLFRNDGLTIDAEGRWTVRGQPTVVERGPGSILVGQSSWARHQAEALRAHRADGRVAPEQWSVSDSSTWAASLLPRLLPALDPLTGTDPTVNEALSYLRNWTYVYEPASIGAVLFEEWMRAYRAEIGRMPTPTDSAFFAGPRRRRTFQQAVRSLTNRHGTDVRRWRWERVATTRRYFPVWTADSLVAADLSPLSTTRYAPLDRPGRGHASTLSGGPTLLNARPLGPAPTAWTGWTWSDTTDLTVRRLRFDPSTFFARSLLSREPPSPVSVREAPIMRTTTLVPAED